MKDYQKILLKFKRNGAPILAFIGVLIVFNEWFFGTGILTYSDWQFLYSHTIESFLFYPSAWGNTQFGGVNIFHYFNVINNAILLLNKVGLTFPQSERLLFMMPSIIFGYWGMYFLCKKITHKVYPSLFSALLFVLNSYFVVINSSHLTILVAMSLIPFILFFIYEYFDSRKIHYLLITSVLLTLTSAYEFRIFYLIACLIFALFAFMLFYSKFTITKVLELFIAGCMIFSLPFIVNFYWMYALLFSKSIASNQFFDRGLFGDAYLNIEKAFTLAHPFWNGNSIIPFSVQKTPLLHWILPIFASFGLFLGKKNIKVLFFGLITLVGIFLTKQSGTPFTEIYLWIFQHVPGFNAFREASKFYIFIILGYSILIGYFLSWISDQKNLKSITFLSYFALTLLTSTFAIPILTKSIGTLFVERNIPGEYLELNQKLFVDSSEFKTLWLPRKSKWSIYDNTHTLVSFDEVILEKCKSILTEASRSGTLSNTMLNCIGAPEFSELLSHAGIRYVIVPSIDIANDDNFYQYYIERSIFIDSLTKVSELQKINLGIKTIDVFENIKYFKTIQLADNPITNSTINESITSPQDSTMNYTKISPDMYEINFENISNIQTVFFSVNYHPLWELQSDDGTKLLYKHEQTSFGFNKFTLQINESCEKISCMQYNNGTYSFKAKLTFTLQQKIDDGIKFTLFLVSVIISIGISTLLFKLVKKFLLKKN